MVVFVAVLERHTDNPSSDGNPGWDDDVEPVAVLVRPDSSDFDPAGFAITAFRGVVDDKARCVGLDMVFSFVVASMSEGKEITSGVALQAPLS